MASFAHYYQTELAYYRQLAREFARHYPEVAHMVAERGNDAAFERLVQGAALLTSRLRFRIDDDFPEIVHALFDKMWPQYLRPIPGATLLQLRGRDNALRQSRLVPASTPVLARPVEDADGSDVECGFITSSEVLLHPLELASVRLDRAHPADLRLELRFELSGGARMRNLELTRLRLHLLGDEPTRFLLYKWLTHDVRRVSALDDDGQHLLALPSTSVSPVGLAADEPLCPGIVSEQGRRAVGTHTPLPGLNLLDEYFACIDKFLGLEVRDCLGTGPTGPGLTRLSQAKGRGFTLAFHLGRVDDGHVDLSADNFAIGCTPAINVSPLHQVSMRITPGTTTVRVVASEAAGTRRRDVPIFSVERVGAYHSESRWVEYQRFVANAARRLDETLPCFELDRRADRVEGVQTYLRLTDVEGRPFAPPTDLLHAWVRHSDGEVAARIPVGSVDVPSSESPEYLTFENVTPVSAADAPRVGGDRHWQLVAQFAIHPRDLASASGLRELVGFARAGRAGRGYPEVVDVVSRPAMRLHRRVMVEVRDIDITLDGSGLGDGERLLFARIINQLFGRPVGSRVLSRVTARYTDSAQPLRFEPH